MIHLLASFLSGIAVDMLSTLLFHYVDKNRGLAAANTNVVLTACWLYVFVDVSKDYTLAIPYLLGIWVGGLLGIRMKAYLENR